MALERYALAVSHGITVEEYNPDIFYREDLSVFITHAHEDHLEGLTKSRAQKLTVYATATTLKLLADAGWSKFRQTQRVDLNQDRWVSLQHDHDVHDTEERKYWYHLEYRAWPAKHAAGSIGIAIRDTVSKQALIFTGDCRTPLLYQASWWAPLFRKYSVNELWLDQSWCGRFQPHSKFPTLRECVQLLERLVDTHHYQHVAFCASVTGIELLIAEWLRWRTSSDTAVSQTKVHLWQPQCTGKAHCTWKHERVAQTQHALQAQGLRVKIRQYSQAQAKHELKEERPKAVSLNGPQRKFNSVQMHVIHPKDCRRFMDDVRSLPEPLREAWDTEQLALVRAAATWFALDPTHHPQRLYREHPHQRPHMYRLAFTTHLSKQECANLTRNAHSSCQIRAFAKPILT